ncbi:MAG: accessory factor UbiK family protein [Casimicrobiaceae bacterium]
MLDRKFFDDINARISEVIAASPVKDIEKNIKAMMMAMFAKLDLVTREEFDVQVQVLQRTREKLDALEAKLARQEIASAASPGPGIAPGTNPEV